ncbi:hypothetical protein SKAU_G00389590 [Synaphobranchus kaupii]|uniref:Uncharacterized protein n=1 Tax=Synaphobranchus kaupii TaxID=118154 RepID=A0A9Q1EBB1_SYNKA|nr:hypothetical protein SKAU_G00389590 [Synaphobranchus kaupii]
MFIIPVPLDPSSSCYSQYSQDSGREKTRTANVRVTRSLALREPKSWRRAGTVGAPLQQNPHRSNPDEAQPSPTRGQVPSQGVGRGTKRSRAAYESPQTRGNKQRAQNNLSVRLQPGRNVLRSARLRHAVAFAGP